MTLNQLWCDNTTFSWWQMLLICIVFFIINSTIFFMMWYMRRGFAIEFGYPKRSRKAMNKKLKSYSKLEEILMVRITCEAERRGAFLAINLVCHFTNILGYSASIIGIVASMITLGDGWALTLLVFSEAITLGVTIFIEFIPHLIWLPSERKRYRK